MRLLKRHTATLLRDDKKGTFNLDGSWNTGSKTEYTFPCLIQTPFRGSQFQIVQPDGVHEKDCREILTKVELFTSSEKDQQVADIVIFQNKEYEVFEVKEVFGASTRTDHYHALMIRRDVLNAN